MVLWTPAISTTKGLTADQNSAWQGAYRYLALGLLHGIEGLARLVGRRGPYGILKLVIGDDLSEDETEQRFRSLLRRPTEDYVTLLAILRWARDDTKLKAVFLRLDELHANWGRLQGLRRGIERLRRAGKKVWVHLNGTGLAEYYVASVADAISISPTATLDVTGLASESVFFLGTLEKLGVEADVIQMGRYKSAGEIFTRRDMSEAHREMMESLLDDLYGQVIGGIAEGRKIDPAAVREIFDRGPFLAREAQDAKLLDSLCYEDEAEQRLVDKCEAAGVIERQDYARRRGREIRARILRESTSLLGMVHVHGTIKSGESVPGPGGAAAAGAATIASALKDLRENNSIKAVLVRVSSPGGSGIASDLIWREIVRTREKKPVVVSLGDVAASGGYYVAIAGGPIFAEPGTITGSIGVLAGKANLRGLYDRLGVSKEIVKRGKHAGLFSDYFPLSPEERERIHQQAQAFYEGFVQKVASARRLTEEAVGAAAEGRVWTGRQAWTRGLVDELGGLEEALERAKQLAGIPTEMMVAVDRYPKPRSLWKLSLDLNRRAQIRLLDVLPFAPHLRFILRERIWAIMPFQIRFF